MNRISHLFERSFLTGNLYIYDEIIYAWLYLVCIRLDIRTNGGPFNGPTRNFKIAFVIGLCLIVIGLTTIIGGVICLVV